MCTPTIVMNETAACADRLINWKGKTVCSGGGVLHLGHKTQIVLQALFKRI